MKIFQKNQHHSNMFLNFGPQHPAAHETLRFTNNFNTKSFSSNNNIKTTQILSVNDDIDRRDYLHIWEFLEVISNLDANRRQSRFIKPAEILTLERDSTENQPEVNVSGLWFKHAKTNLWSMLVLSDLSNKDIGQMLLWREPTTDIKDDYIFHRLLKTKDILDQDKYSFHYNNKSYEMDGTLDREFVYQIVNNELLLDPKIIQNFFDGLNVNPDSTDFDWLVTLAAETGPQPTQTFDNQQIGIMLPALFNNSARYQIYIHSACAIQSVGEDKKVRIWESNNTQFFSPIRLLEIPAPVKFSERKLYSDFVNECYEMDGSIAPETWSSILEHGAQEMRTREFFRWMSDYLTNFYRLRDLARLQGIKHQNRDWVIHILASLLVAESATTFSNGMGIELGNISKKLTIKEIVKLVGYYFPVYNCLGIFNYSLEEVSKRRHQKWLKDKKIREMKIRHKTLQSSNQQTISSNTVSKRRMGGKALIAFAQQMHAQVNLSPAMSPGNKLITQYLIENNVNKIIGSKSSHFVLRSYLEKAEYFSRRPALSTHASFSFITKKDIQTNFDGRKGIFFPNQETIDSLNQSLSPDIIYDDMERKFPFASFCSHKSVTRADIPISHWSTIELIDKFSLNQQLQIQEYLERACQNGTQLLLDAGPIVYDDKRKAILTEIPMFLNFELLKQFFEFDPYVKYLDTSGVEVQKLGRPKTEFSKCIPTLTESLDRNISLVSKNGIEFINTDFQYTVEYLEKQAKVSVFRINSWLNNLPKSMYQNLLQTAVNYK